MAILKEEVERIAKLARLSFDEEEKQKLQMEISSILDYVDELKKVEDKVDIKHFEDKDALNLMRDDIAEPSVSPFEFIDQAPEKEGSSIKVRSVLE